MFSIHLRRVAALCCLIATVSFLTTSYASAVTYPSGVEEVSAPTNKYTSGRSRTIDSLIVHTVEGGTLDGTVNYFKNTDRNISVHYVIDKNGDVVQMVDSWDTAWTQNYYNSRSIGFEMVGYAGQASTWYYQPWESKYGTTYNNLRPNVDKLANICAYFIDHPTWKQGAKYDIPFQRIQGDAYDYPNNTLNMPGIGGHYQVTPGNKTDPGIYFPWDDLMLFVDSYLENNENIYWPVQVPEPASILLLSLGSLALIRRR
ncbi:N-acetylmuramoyl-L-alanine amidase A [Poriferisphaera corsica]|uniref:N-acetylmuramoyl-L-alanine amidase n=1 Tax=Poriferisphaera corsica TaxID=2528020 RepID=A0A517YPQ9_9BACT|nr:peptidoglycan recognition family protein [Poriferisphaera corsica]QDU32188.1 N-acetylmuramoyl-L-alanine amidase A [Poriferisphaera corsica]